MNSKTSLEKLIGNNTDTSADETYTSTEQGNNGTNKSNNTASDNSNSVRSSTSLDYHRTTHGTPTDHTEQRNICPQCMTSGPKADNFNRYWSCEDEDCGVVKYASGWFERKMEEWSSHNGEFLTSINWPATMDRVDKRINT